MSWLLLLQVLDELLIAHHRLGPGSVDIAASDSFTPVHAACFHNSVEALVLLLTSKLFDVNARGRDGFTPLHIAAKRGALLPIMFLMMDGAKRSFRTEAGDTAADIADRHGSTTVKVRAALFLGHVLRRLLIPTRCHFVSLNWLRPVSVVVESHQPAHGSVCVCEIGRSGTVSRHAVCNVSPPRQSIAEHGLVESVRSFRREWRSA